MRSTVVEHCTPVAKRRAVLGRPVATGRLLEEKFATDTRRTRAVSRKRMANPLSQLTNFPKFLGQFLSADNQLFFLNDSESIGIDDADKPTCADNKRSNIQY